MEQLARKLNSAQVINPEQDGFFVELTFIKTMGRGGKKWWKRGKPSANGWEKMAKKKQCIVQIQNKEDLCLARAIVTMKERADEGSHNENLKPARPIQERWAGLLHQEANVAEGPCGCEELEKFQ